MAHCDLTEVSADAAAEAGLRPWHLWLAWMACLLPLLLFSGSANCSRTQEGRVLETAREMVQGLSPWLTPHCNGVLRLKKPPLCYWMTGAGFKLGGINEWAGRMPMVLTTWLTIGICTYAGATLFGRRAGLMVVALMAASHGTFRYGRLAETDTVAMLGAVLATWSFWRSAQAAEATTRRRWNWAAGGGLAIALMSKGGPAAFPLVFLAGWCAVHRTVRPLWWFVRSGGLLVALVLGLAWYAYLWHTQGLAVVWSELRVVTAGEWHTGPFYYYLYTAPLLITPWVAIAIAALVEAVRQCRTDRRVLGLLLWFGSCFIPLSMIGQKQAHYALALVPASALLGAWVLDQSLRSDAPARVRLWLPRLLWLTIAVAMLLSLAIPLARIFSQQAAQAADYGLATIGFVFSLVALLSVQRKRLLQGVLVFSAGLALVLSFAFSAWGQTLKGTPVGDVARLVAAEYGQGPYLMFDDSPDLPTVFAMGQFATASQKPKVVAAWMKQHPNGVVLLVGKMEDKRDKLPDWLMPEKQFGKGETAAWRLVRKPAATSPVAP